MRVKYALFFAMTVCVPSLHLASESAMKLHSTAFNTNSVIPSQYTCAGDGNSPQLAWRDVPTGTRAFALIVDDPDAPSGTFVHWVVYNIASNVTELPENALKSQATSQSAIQGVNGADQIGYRGPCPPPGKPHHYHFRLFALDSPLDLKAGASADEVRQAIKGHVLGQTELVGVFGR
jgi:Raf kinase inhibitor-like YbhB/YbcL family protein